MKTRRLVTFFALWMLVALCSAHAADEAIVLETPTGKLAGSLLMPARSGRMPVALIIAGSGPTDRDGNSALQKEPNDSLKMLAQMLADAGYASVRYDKRGIGASTAAMRSEADLRFDTYIDDAAAWIDKLARDPRFSSVVVIGHSEGSLIGMVAARKGKANGFISLAGAGSAAYDVLRRQLAGKLPGELAVVNERILTALQHGEKSEPVPPALAALYRPSVQPYLISYFKYLPSERIAMLDVPVLIVQGDTDIQMDRAEAAALATASPHAQLALIPGMNHVLKMVPADRQRQIASYGDPTLPLAPALQSAILDFMGKLEAR